jgi:hypothetical protein
MRLEDDDNSRQLVIQPPNRDAVYDQIYERYGSDLAAFFRDVYREVAARREKAERRAANDAEAITVR